MLRGSFDRKSAFQATLRDSFFAQLCALLRRLMLLNMGSRGSTLLAIVAAGSEEALLRSLVPPLDTALRRWLTGKGPLGGAALAVQARTNNCLCPPSQVRRRKCVSGVSVTDDRCNACFDPHNSARCRPRT